MANSVNFSTSNGYIVYWISIVQNSQSIPNNTSTATVEVWCKRTNTGYTTFGSGTTNITINGVAYSDAITSAMTITSTARKMLTRTVTVAHNADGTKTLPTTNCSISHSSFDSTAPTSFSLALTTIPRASTISAFGNFTIGATVAATIAGVASFTHNTSLYVNGTLIASRTHAAGVTNATYTLTAAEQTACYTAMGSSYTGTATFYLKTMSGATQIGSTASKTSTVTATATTISSFTNFTIGNVAPITMTRPVNATWTNNLELKIGSTLVAARTGLTTAGTITLSAAENNIMYAALANSTSGTVTVYCTTKNGSTTIGSVISDSAIATVSDTIKPTLTSITATGYIASIGNSYIRNITPITFTINGAAGASYSTITSYNINFNGVNYTTATVNTGLPNFTSTVALPRVATATVTDSRGRTATATINMVVLDYTTPTITSFIVDRASDVNGTVNVMGAFAKVSHVATAKSLKPATIEYNLLTYKLYSKARSSSTWVLIKTATSLLSLTGFSGFSGYPVTTSYDFKIEVRDLFNIAVVSTDVMSTGQVTMSLGKVGIGVGKIWEAADGALGVEGNAKVNGSVAATGFVGPLTGNVTGTATPLAHNHTTATITDLPTPSSAATASTTVLRDSSADITCRLVRSNYTDESAISGGIVFRKSTTDNYLRTCNSPDAITKWLGMNGSSLSGVSMWYTFPNGFTIQSGNFDTVSIAATVNTNVTVTVPLTYTGGHTSFTATAAPISSTIGVNVGINGTMSTNSTGVVTIKGSTSAQSYRLNWVSTGWML